MLPYPTPPFIFNYFFNGMFPLYHPCTQPFLTLQPSLNFQFQNHHPFNYEQIGIEELNPNIPLCSKCNISPVKKHWAPNKTSQKVALCFKCYQASVIEHELKTCTISCYTCKINKALVKLPREGQSEVVQLCIDCYNSYLSPKQQENQNIKAEATNVGQLNRREKNKVNTSSKKRNITKISPKKCTQRSNSSNTYHLAKKCFVEGPSKKKSKMFIAKSLQQGKLTPQKEIPPIPAIIPPFLELPQELSKIPVKDFLHPETVQQYNETITNFLKNYVTPSIENSFPATPEPSENWEIRADDFAKLSEFDVFNPANLFSD